MLFPTKSLIVVAFALKQLLKVRFAVKFTVQCGVTAQAVEAENNWVRARRPRRVGREVGREGQERT